MSKTPTRSRRKTKSTRARRAQASDFDPAFRARTFADAEAGDITALRHYCREAALMIEAGRPLPDRPRAFFAKALHDIADGVDTNVAFRIKVGHRRKTPRAEQVSMAYDVWKRTRKGMKTTKAFEEVARTCRKSVEVVREAYYRHKQQLDPLK